MKKPSILLSLVASFFLVSCGNNQGNGQNSDVSEDTQQQNNEVSSQNSSQSSAVETFRTNKGDIPYERAVNYCYQLGYEHGNNSRTNILPQKCREDDMEHFKTMWTGLYGVPTSTEESREAYKACFEEYKRGYDESFYGTDDL